MANLISFVDVSLEAYPHLQCESMGIRRTRPTAVFVEDEELDEELLLPEAFTQMSVGSPSNATTGEAVPARSLSLRTRTLRAIWTNFQSQASRDLHTPIIFYAAYGKYPVYRSMMAVLINIQTSTTPVLCHHGAFPFRLRSDCLR